MTPPKCCQEDCQQPAEWVPAIAFRPAGHGPDCRCPDVPVVLSLPFCSLHGMKFRPEYALTPAMRESLLTGFRMAGLQDPDFHKPKSRLIPLAEYFKERSPHAEN